MKKEIKDSKNSEEIIVDKISEPLKSQESEGKIGSLLKEKRLSKGLKIVEVAENLRIRRVYLEAIEESRYEEIPAFPYGIGFIRSYADYLGLNGQRIVQMYKDETETNQRKNSGYFVLEPQAEASVPSSQYLLISLLGIAAIYAGWYFYNQSQVQEIEIVEEPSVVEMSQPEQLPLVVEDYAINEAAPANPVDVVLQTVEVAPVENVASAQISVTNEAFNPEAVEAPKTEPQVEQKVEQKGLVINIKKETWLEVKTPTKLYLSKVLKEGDSYTIPSDIGLTLSVGKYDAVEVLKDGKVINVVKPNKKMNINLDGFLNSNH